MPDPKTWRQWIELGDTLLAEARGISASHAGPRAVARLTGQSAEAYLKGVLCSTIDTYRPKSDRHDIVKMLMKAAQHYPRLREVEGRVQLLAEVSYRDPESGENGACSLSAETFYELELTLDESDAEARVEAAEAIGRAAKHEVPGLGPVHE